MPVIGPNNNTSYEPGSQGKQLKRRTRGRLADLKNLRTWNSRLEQRRTRKTIQASQKREKGALKVALPVETRSGGEQQVRSRFGFEVLDFATRRNELTQIGWIRQTYSESSLAAYASNNVVILQSRFWGWSVSIKSKSQRGQTTARRSVPWGSY